MSESIRRELALFVNSMGIGGILLLAYDIVLAIRKNVPHPQPLVSLEDLLYWIGTGVFVFVCMYGENQGRIRIFAVFGILLGVLLCHFTVSPFFCRILGKAMEIPIKILAFLTKRLLFFWKRVRISLDKSRQKYIGNIKNIAKSKREKQIEKSKKKETSKE